MSYTNGSVNNANPGATLYALLETALLAIGFTLEDTVVISTRTHKILKSAAGGNTRGVDWYLDISFTTTGAGALMMAPFEGYTAASDLGIRGPYSANSTTFETTNYSAFGPTGNALETSWANSVSHTSLQLALVASTAFTYRFTYSRDRVVLSLSNAPTQILYAGFYTPTAAALSYQGGSCIPLIVCRIASGGSANSSTSASTVTAAFTRLPKYPDISATYMNSGWGGSCLVAANQLLLGGRAGDFVHPGSGDLAYSPYCVMMGGSSSGFNTGLVGYLDGVLMGYTSATSALGDTVVQGSDTYYVTTHSSQVAVAVKAA
jgi:hypothetical protein